MRREGEEKEAKMIGLTPYPVLCRPSRATLCHESFVISSIRCLTSASDMPVAMAIISTDAPDANNLRIVAFFSFSGGMGTGTLVHSLGSMNLSPMIPAACSTPTVSSMPSPGDRDTTREGAPD